MTRPTTASICGLLKSSGPLCDEVGEDPVVIAEPVAGDVVGPAFGVACRELGTDGDVGFLRSRFHVAMRIRPKASDVVQL